MWCFVVQDINSENDVEVASAHLHSISGQRVRDGLWRGKGGQGWGWGGGGGGMRRVDG